MLGYSSFIIGCSVLFGLICSVNAFGSNFLHDGSTTYCWSSTQDIFAEDLDKAKKKNEGKGLHCPIKMSLQVSNHEPQVNEAIDVKWTVTTNFQPHSIFNNFTKLYKALDPVTGTNVSVIHSNVHACLYGSNCDPYNDGQSPISPTDTQVGNFKDGSVTFRAENVKIPSHGHYSLLVHIVLVSQQPKNLRYDFATYAKINVSEKNSEAPKEKELEPEIHEPEEESMALVVLLSIAGTIAVILIAGAAVYFRRKNQCAKKDFEYNHVLATSNEHDTNTKEGHTSTTKAVTEEPSVNHQHQIDEERNVVSLSEFMRQTKGFSVSHPSAPSNSQHPETPPKHSEGYFSMCTKGETPQDRETLTHSRFIENNCANVTIDELTNKEYGRPTYSVQPSDLGYSAKRTSSLRSYNSSVYRPRNSSNASSLQSKIISNMEFEI